MGHQSLVCRWSKVWSKDFDVYLGRIKEPMLHGLGYHVIMKMAEDCLGKGHHIFFDNFFHQWSWGRISRSRRRTCVRRFVWTVQGGPRNWTAPGQKKMKAGDVHFLQDGNMVATLWRTKDLLPSCLPMLSHGCGKQRGRLQEERRRYWFLCPFWRTTPAWMGLISLISTTPTIQWVALQSDGGIISAGGFFRQLWWTLSYCSRTATCQHKPQRGTVTSTFALKSWHHCARVALFVIDINTSLSPRLESLQLHLWHMALHYYLVERGTAWPVVRPRSAPTRAMAYKQCGAVWCVPSVCAKGTVLHVSTNTLHKTLPLQKNRKRNLVDCSTFVDSFSVMDMQLKFATFSTVFYHSMAVRFLKNI